MSATQNKNLILHLLQKLEDKGIPLTKIALQKALFFLKASGIPLPMTFEPYTYGPYSFDLAAEFNDMTFWGILSEHNNSFTANEQPTEPLPQELSERIDHCLDQFLVATSGRTDFNTLELMGTALYCLKTLQAEQIETSDDHLLTLFKQWKNDRYPDNAIIEMGHTLLRLQ